MWSVHNLPDRKPDYGLEDNAKSFVYLVYDVQQDDPAPVEALFGLLGGYPKNIIKIYTDLNKLHRNIFVYFEEN